MLKLKTLEEDRPALQDRDWPPVPRFSRFTPEIRDFLGADRAERGRTLAHLRPDPEAHCRFVNDGLGLVYAYLYGYADSPCRLRSDLELETALLSAKIELEAEMIERWLEPHPIPAVADQRAASAYLREFSRDNPGVLHPLFDYLRDDAPRDVMIEFLRLEVCRNEVVDDEVALLVCGLQGSMKKVMASNLWDECGNGNLAQFHTYWLRRLMDGLGDWEGLPAYRATHKPWFATITSNSFNTLVTRPGYKLRAYGHFMVTEGWVQPHFERILAGLARAGLDRDDIAVYFRAHAKIDPHHTEEMLEGLEFQLPALNEQEAAEVVRGAHQAAAAGLAQYERVLRHLRAAAGT